MRRVGSAAALIFLIGALLPTPPAQATHSSLRWPVTGTVISDFGDCRSGCSRYHEGYDLSARDPDGDFDDEGDAVIASYAGRVIFAGVKGSVCGSSYGRVVYIDHGAGYVTVYAHLRALTVFAEQVVSTGQQIGTEGTTGNASYRDRSGVCRRATPPHVHFEIRRHSTPLDLSHNGTGQSCNERSAICVGQRFVAGNPIPYHFDGLASEASAFPKHVEMDAPPGTRGYWLAAEDGGVFSYGNAAFHGSMGSQALAQPVVDIAATPTGDGYWLAAGDGGVFAFGDAPFLGSAAQTPLNAQIVAIAGSPSGRGYWLTGADGGVFAFGDAIFHGSLAKTTLNAPIVAIAASPSGAGYWLVGADGGVFAFGDAPFYGSMGDQTLAAPVVDIAVTPAGLGYWLAAEDGGVFAFGNAQFYGGMANRSLNAPVTGMRRTRSGEGYWLVAEDGGVFSFGNADFLGSNTR